MSAIDALLDSNVIVAMVAEKHQDHVASAALLTMSDKTRFAVAAHSYAEAYSTLTRRNASARFRWSAGDAWMTLESVMAATILVGLSPPQVLAAIRDYAAKGDIGPRLYDRLIGEVAVRHAIPSIITLNRGHMRDLFPKLQILEPAEALRV